MNKYLIEFTKQGIIAYTSHLDLLRLFKRTFKRAEISLSHSQGFNPHPKIGFGQPLSLGYESTCELIEFETGEDYKPNEIIKELQLLMPQGISLNFCKKIDVRTKSIASLVVAADYTVKIPLLDCIKNIFPDNDSLVTFLDKYMEQDEIITKKRQKKTKKYIDVNIKNKIKKITDISLDDNISFTLHLDCGSKSNLSPDLVLNSLFNFASESEILKIRNMTKITRIQFFFDNTYSL